MDGFRLVFTALGERMVTEIADGLDVRGAKRQVIHFPAVRTDPPADEPLGDLLGREFEMDGGIEWGCFGREQQVERLGLSNGAGEAVEHEATAALQAVAPLLQQSQRDAVGDIFAAQGAGLRLSEGGAGRRGTAVVGATEFAGRKGAGAEHGFEESGLGAFAGARRAEQNEAPRTLHTGRRLAAENVSTLKPRGGVAHSGHGPILTAGDVACVVNLAEDCAGFARCDAGRSCASLRKTCDAG